MFFPKVFHTISQSPFLLTIVAAFEILSCLGMHHKCHLANFHALEIPDVWFGYTPNDIYDWLESIGPHGRRNYLDIMKWDFVPYMPSYMFLLGSVLCKLCESSSGGSNNAILVSSWRRYCIPWIAPLIMAFDIVETGSNYFLTVQFPKKVEVVVILSSIANQIKWVLFGIGIVQLVALLIHRNLKPKRH